MQRQRDRVQRQIAARYFGSPDDMKFASSMTLFDAVEPKACFARALDKYCGGARDRQTLRLRA
jgi:uncharacterized protein (DUF1810 family)